MKAGGVAMGLMATLACFLPTTWSSSSEAEACLPSPLEVASLF